MEKHNLELEQRVWKRVRGEEQAGVSVQSLMAAEQDEAAVHLMLSRQMQGREKAMLRKIFEEDRCHAAMLRGMNEMMTGKRLVTRTAPPAPQTPETALRKSYARKLQALSEYEKRCADPEYGMAFSKMAQQEKEHCALILEILGSFQR